MDIIKITAILAIVFGLLSLVGLFMLHFLSREFDPSWRMISEYALGKSKWLITAFFILWGISSILTSLWIGILSTSIWSKIGITLIGISGLGAIMGGLFDIKHKYHGLSFLLGVPTLPIGAILVSYDFIHLEKWSLNKLPILFSAHSTWISLILMAISMIVMISGFNKAGIPMGPNVEPQKSVPAGVIAWNGYTNRILVLSYIGWPIVMAWVYLVK